MELKYLNTLASKLKILRPYQQLLLATGLSIVLHAIMLSGVQFSLANFTQPTQVLEARLELPKKVSAIQPKVKPPLKLKPVKPKQEKAALKQALKPQTPLLENQAPVSQALPAPEPTERAETAPAPEAVAETPADAIEPDLSNTPLALNPNAYRHVEMQYSVSTKIDGPSQGKSTIVFDLNDQDAYSLTWKTQASGLAAMFVDDLVQTSAGKLGIRGLQPMQYTYRYGDKVDKNRTASFDWPTKKVALQTAQGTEVLDLPNDTQDVLSFMYQFMYVAPLEMMELPITTGRKLAVYQYVFEGEEEIQTALGAMRTVHVSDGGGDGEAKAELWLAADNQNLPVKIRKTEKNGKVYEFVVNRINTARPAPIMP